MQQTKTGLVPQEDTAAAFVSMNSKPGTSMKENIRIMNQLSEKLEQIPEVDYTAGIAGWSFSGLGPSMGMFFLTLSDWEEDKERVSL